MGRPGRLLHRRRLRRRPLPALGDASRDGCDRTTNAYPDVVDRELAEFPPGKPVHLTNVSCGNATIADIATAKQKPISPVQPPADGWPAVDTQIQRAHLTTNTDVVTIGVGGNSLPFGGMLLTCLQQGAIGKSCRDHFTNPPPARKASKKSSPASRTSTSKCWPTSTRPPPTPR
ncbi:hypothetical protein ACFQ9X_08555 [Catenulispora yoronensis]